MSLLNGVKLYDDGTASDLAFRKTFRVAIQNKFLRTEEIIKWMGTPTTGNRVLDRQLQNNFVEILATPIACVEYYLMGAPIKFRNAGIPNQILTILRQHVKNWDYIINNFHNVEPPPMEEMDDIIEFCELIVKFAGANKGRNNIWLISGKAAVRGAETISGTSVLDVGARRRKLAVAEAKTEETKSGTESRTEKMMNFRKNFAKQREENK